MGVEIDDVRGREIRANLVLDHSSGMGCRYRCEFWITSLLAGPKEQFEVHHRIHDGAAAQLR